MKRAMRLAEPAPRLDGSGTRRFRHDLLNRLNVIMGATSVLLETELTVTQRTCVNACRSAAERILGMADQLESYMQDSSIDGAAQLADLCSIAAARIDKPFDRRELVSTVRQLAPVPVPRVLLVDDAPDIEVLVRTFLKDTGSIIDVVPDGERAVAQASSQPYDIVLMDVGLPGMDGATAAHAIRAVDLARGSRPTPIVALSAYGAELPHTNGSEDRDVVASRDVVVIDDPEIASLAPAFLDKRRADVGRLREALAAGDYTRIEALGHRMKGTGRGYGFVVVSRIGSDLELAGHQQNSALAVRLLDELEDYLARVQVQTPGAARQS